MLLSSLLALGTVAPEPPVEVEDDRSRIQRHLRTVACFAECLDVEVAYQGQCKGEDTTTGWPSPGTGGESTAGSSGTADDTDGTGAGATGTGGEHGTTGETSATSGPDGGATTGASTTAGATTAAETDAPQDADDDGLDAKGCGCRSSGPAGGWLALVLGLALRRRRST